MLFELYGLSWFPTTRPLDWLSAGQVALAVLGVVFLPWRSFALFVKECLLYVVAQWRRARWLIKLVMGGLGGVLIVYFFFGFFLNPSGIDSLMYHIPVAVQPFQDGRVNTFDSSVPWTYLYPKAVELVWSWTLLVARSDLLFLPILFLFGL
jgi:hypothetical protein